MGHELNGAVECHSGHAYADRPIALHWQGERLEIVAVEAEWRTPDGHFFRVRATGERKFELFYSELKDEWKIIEL